MFRWLFVCLLLAIGAFALVAFLSGKKWDEVLPTWVTGIIAPSTNPTTPEDQGDTPHATVPQPDRVNTPEAEQERIVVAGTLNGAQPVIISGGRILMWEQQEVASRSEGRILFLGVEVTDPLVAVPENKLLLVDRFYLAVKCNRGEEGAEQIDKEAAAYRITEPVLGSLAALKKPLPKEALAKLATLKTVELYPYAELIKGLYTVLGEKDYARYRNLIVDHAESNKDQHYREWQERDELKADSVIVLQRRMRVRRLEEDNVVEKGQILAMINPEAAVADLRVQVAELKAATAEAESTERMEKITGELYRRYAKSDAISVSEKLKAESEWRRAEGDRDKARASILSAQAKLMKAAVALRFQEVHAMQSGRVTHIYKNPGDSVKASEPLVQLRNPRYLQVESVLALQDAWKLTEGMEVVVEAARPEAPRPPQAGHLKPVTCITVSKGPKPEIISGDEDQLLRGWDLATGAPRWTLPLHSVPRSVACTGKPAEDNLLLVGDNAGVGRIYDLNPDKAKQRPKILADAHKGPINCVAFSATGKICATGGEDQWVYLWDTASGTKLNGWKAHRYPVTSLQFTASEGAKESDRLFTVGADPSVIVWDVTDPKTGAPVRKVTFDARSGDVAQLGVTPDGKRLLLDQGRNIQVLSVDTRLPEGTLVNPAGTLSFSTMALFSPDGTRILTNGNAPGRLQLWRAPPGRPAEIRQLIWGDGVVTCGAFAEDGTIVAGTSDHKVLVWPRPEDLKPVKGKLTMVERMLDTRSQDVRVRAQVENEDGQLIPGGTATIEVPPQP
jgi:WD40 repeat protein